MREEDSSTGPKFERFISIIVKEYFVRPPIVHTYRRRGRKVNVQAPNDERIIEKDRVGGPQGVMRGSDINVFLGLGS